MIGPLVSGLGAETNRSNPPVAPPPARSKPAPEFELPPGFRLELAGEEPMVVSPVALAFDENGRLLVLERQDVGSTKGPPTHTGRVKILEDANEDGRFQSSTVLVDNLPWASALACYGGGVFVAARQIFYFKEGAADTAPEAAKPVLVGFGEPTSPDQVLNSFNWGPDHRIHGATAGLGGIVGATNTAAASASLAGSDFSFDPRTLAIRPEAGPAQSGLAFDSAGRKLLCDYARPLRLAMYEPDYTARNPFFPKAPVLSDVLSPATVVFPLTGVPPRTPAWIEGARGLAVYRGGLFPTNYFENVFIPDPEHHLIHRVVLRDNGLGLTALPASTSREFLASSDEAFRPVQLINGPDGALYIADMRDGPDRGRIYRLVPDWFKAPKPPRLGQARTRDLVAALASPNGWYRDTASRLLFERRDPAALPLLSDMLYGSAPPLARLEALHALDGLDRLTQSQLAQALRDTDARVREQAVALTERFVTNGLISDSLWIWLRPLAGDPSVRVRCQLAFTLGQIRRPDCTQALADLARSDLTNIWVRTAVLSSVPQGSANLLILLANDRAFRNHPDGLGFLRTLGTMLGLKGPLEAVSPVLDFIARTPLEPLPALALLNAVAEGMHRAGGSLAQADPQGRLTPLYNQVPSLIVGAAEPVRLEATELLCLIPIVSADPSGWLPMLANAQSSPTLWTAALRTLGRFDDPHLADAVLLQWQGFAPRMRGPLVAALLDRTNRVEAVLTALEAGQIDTNDLASTQVNFLQNYRDPTVRRRAIRLFGLPATTRPEAIQAFRPALRLIGAPDRGREIFLARCAQCHALAGAGYALGPNLAAARTRGKDQMLKDILQPGAEIAPGYHTSVVETREGELLIGLVTDEALAAFTLRQPGSPPAIWPRSNVQSIQAQPWSLMPNGLERGLSPQDMADLLRFLMVSQ